MATPASDPDDGPTISLPPNFQISSQDGQLGATVKQGSRAAPIVGETPPAPLGVLSNFNGKFKGHGLNMIFRPNSGQTTFQNPLPPPAPPQPPNENVLELNLTSEKLTFGTSLGNVPNRGLEQQQDIFLNGVPYVQAINDVTNLDTGKGDAKITPDRAIHFEPGLWMHVPETDVDPVIKGESLNRMASIPHGTTINAQCLQPTQSAPGPPPFTGPNALPKVDITPFVINQPGNLIRFASQTAASTNTPRLPQDLTKFIQTGTITQAILDNPNLVLANSIAGQNITNTIVFTVSTTPVAPFVAGGTANIDFLNGTNVNAATDPPGPNANAVSMKATFWIETVQVKVPIPVFHQGSPALKIKVSPASATAEHPPEFSVTPPHDITAPTTVTASYTQIQYMQTVFLNFAGLTWPHVSCATLVPSTPVTVPASAFS